MTIYSRHGGSWKAATPYVRHSGSWKKPKEVFVRRNGKWTSVWQDIKEIRYSVTTLADRKGNWYGTLKTFEAGDAMPPFLSGSKPNDRRLLITAAQGIPGQSSGIYAGSVYMYELLTSNGNLADQNFRTNHPLNKVVSLELRNKTTNKRLEYWTPSDSRAYLGGISQGGHGFYAGIEPLPVKTWDNDVQPGQVIELRIRGRW
ncbi:hypothetical protein [Shimia sp.]|uniref:hypothetical protein n=1 Tax=Shimia sp. TaxID=1954381 RepID=UPI003BAA6AF1